MLVSHTTLSIKERGFLIDGNPIYSEVPGAREQALGLLMNARFIQGVFDDATGRARYARWGRDAYDPEVQTDQLIAALPEWYGYGLRGFTVGFQGGGPCFTLKNASIDNNPFGPDGASLDPAYEARMDRLIRGADRAGMVVILSLFYQGQIHRLEDGRAIRRAIQTAGAFLKNGGYTNVILEIANEMNVNDYQAHPIIYHPEGMAALIDLGREASGGLAVGCSGGGGYHDREVTEASDVVLFHGNGQRRQGLANMIRQIRLWAPEKPVLCNEDSQALSNLAVAVREGASWGYYNNMTKQEPPTSWEITPGEDRFFAQRMAEAVGIQVDPIPEEDQFYLQGFEPDMEYEGKRWVRLASLYPEQIDRVDHYRNGEFYYSSYEDPFSVHYNSNWSQDGIDVRGIKTWRAEIHLADGRVLERTAEL
jgi:hypothetical protein